jgi:hypothetical protein
MSPEIDVASPFEPIPVTVRRAVAAYFTLQGVAVILWWWVLFAVPSAREWFRMSPAPDDTLLAFALPDLLILAPASLLGAVLVARRYARAPAILWLAAGGSVYAALYCVAFALRTDAGWPGAALMLPSALLSASCAAAATPGVVALLRQPSLPSSGETVILLELLSKRAERESRC